jgi:hypothetical protein
MLELGRACRVAPPTVVYHCNLAQNEPDVSLIFGICHTPGFADALQYYISPDQPINAVPTAIFPTLSDRAALAINALVLFSASTKPAPFFHRGRYGWRNVCQAIWLHHQC